MNITGKLAFAFALVIAAGLVATGAAVKMDGPSQPAAPTIQLSAVIVTPAQVQPAIELAAVHVTAKDAQPTIELAAVHVTPNNAQPTIELAAVRVVPTPADREYARTHGISLPVATLASAHDVAGLGQIGTQVLINTLAVLGPGQFLNSNALHTLEALAFGEIGR